jgi:hypothetical protein
MKSKLIAALAAAMMSAGTASANIMNVTATRRDGHQNCRFWH